MTRAVELLSLPAVLLTIWAQILSILLDHRNGRDRAEAADTHHSPRTPQQIKGESGLRHQRKGAIHAFGLGRRRDRAICSPNLARTTALAGDSEPPLDELLQAWSL